MDNMIKKKARVGKKKRDMELIDDIGSRRVTFSKRRIGVFKKASELCILTGAEGAVLCESLGGRVYAFGHPTVESVVDKYLGDKSSSELPENSSAATETHVNSPCMHELQKQYLEISKEMEIEKNKLVNVMEEKNGNFINDNNMVEGDLFWWQQPFEHLEGEEPAEYISSMEELMNKLKLRANDLMLIRSSSSMFDASKTLINSNVAALSVEYVANRILNLKDYGLQDEFFTNKNLNMKDYGLPDEFFANKNLNFNNDGLLAELLAIKDPNFDDGVDYGNNVQVPNINGNTGSEVQLSHMNGNLVVPENFGEAVELHNSDTAVLPNDFSFFGPPK